MRHFPEHAPRYDSAPTGAAHAAGGGGPNAKPDPTDRKGRAKALRVAYALPVGFLALVVVGIAVWLCRDGYSVSKTYMTLTLPQTEQAESYLAEVKAAFLHEVKAQGYLDATLYGGKLGGAIPDPGPEMSLWQIPGENLWVAVDRNDGPPQPENGFLGGTVGFRMVYAGYGRKWIWEENPMADEVKELEDEMKLWWQMHLRDHPLRGEELEVVTWSGPVNPAGG